MKFFFYSLALFLLVLGAFAVLERTAPLDHAGIRRSAPSPAVRTGDAPPSHDVNANAAGRSGGDPAGAVALADTLIALWHPREAAAVLESVLEEDSLRVDARVLLMEALDGPLLADEDGVRRAEREAWACARSPADSLFLTGMRALLIDRDASAAVGTFRRLEAGAPSTPGLERNLVRALLEAGLWDEAQQRMAAGLERSAGDPTLLELSVRLAIIRGDAAGAAGFARRFGRAWPQEPFSYVLMAQTDLMRGDPESAGAFIRSALELDPRYIPAIVAQGNLFSAAGRYRAARVSCEKMLLFDDPVLQSIGYDGLAAVEFLDGEFDAAASSLDGAIRSAMLAGAVRLGLRYAMRLVNSLCELGQSDTAKGVIEEWVSGFGEVPETLAGLRVDVLDGEFDRVDRSLVLVSTDADWREWAHTLSLDTTELAALARIGRSDFGRTVALLNASGEAASGARDPSARARREFLRGYAALEAGHAEDAVTAFDSTRSMFFSTTFPYRGDPVLHVQSLFYLGECALAAGRVERARSAYAAFTEKWKNSPWSLTAIERAMKKIDSLPGGSADPPAEGADKTRNGGGSGSGTIDSGGEVPDSTR